MTETDETAKPVVAVRRSLPSKAKLIIGKFIAATLFTAMLAILQGWASTHTYKPDQKAGFHMGILHGIIMPAALPGLLTGHDLPIYATSNLGRAYNIGYILGINTSGTIFFGIAFWGFGGTSRPKRD